MRGEGVVSLALGLQVCGVGAFVAAPLAAAPQLASRARRGAGACRMSVGLGEAIVRALVDRYPRTDIQRVLDSWNRIRSGDEFTKDWGEKGMQQAGSYVEGLFAEPWHDVDSYPWAKGLEERAPAIAEELRRVNASAKLAEEGTNVWAAAVREEAIAYGPNWKTLVLQDRQWEPTNSAIFTETVKALKELEVPSMEAFFARQEPHTGIKPHTDNTNFILTAHLGLDVPEGECWIRVGNERREWRNGKLMVFDTSFVHETGNEADTDRTVLLIRFWHPALTEVERKALQFIFEALEDPALLESSGGPGDQQEQQKQPELPVQAGEKVGGGKEDDSERLGAFLDELKKDGLIKGHQTADEFVAQGPEGGGSRQARRKAERAKKKSEKARRSGR